MADYVLSDLADQDLLEIYLFSYERFGEAKADAYLTALHERFLALAESPRMGRKIDAIRQGYFRYEYVRHTIFYTIREQGGIFVVRVLHQRQDAESNLL
jgi:toxin ParE1/3/4